MKKILLSAFVLLGLSIFTHPAKAQTVPEPPIKTLYLNDGGYDAVTGEKVVFCFSPTECYDVKTLQRIGDVSAKVDETSAKVDQLNQKIDQLQNTITTLQQTVQQPVVSQPVATPAPAPAPVEASPVVAGVTQAPSCTLTATSPTNTQWKINLSWTFQGLASSTPGRIYGATQYIGGQPQWGYANQDNGGYPVVAQDLGTSNVVSSFDFELILGSNFKADKYNEPKAGDVVCTAKLTLGSN